VGPELRSILEKPLAPDKTAVMVRTAGLIYILVIRLHRYADDRDAQARYSEYLEGLVQQAVSRRLQSVSDHHQTD
jgi:hypothetical protein